MPHLKLWKQIINHLPVSHKFHQINWKTTRCLITKTDSLTYSIVKFKINCLPVSWLSSDFYDNYLMLQFCMP